MDFAFLAFLGQADPTGGGLSRSIMSLLPFLLIFVLMYFLMMRPQMKKQKEQASMLNSLRKGDDVVTAGGIHGRIIQANEKDPTIQVQIARGIIVSMDRSFVVRKKGAGTFEPAAPEPRPKETPKERTKRPDTEAINRDSRMTQVPNSGMVTTGARTTPEGREGEDSRSRRNRYRRSRRRKPSGGGQDNQSQGQSTPVKEPSSDTSTG